jgi:hypothetical protein
VKQRGRRELGEQEEVEGGRGRRESTEARNRSGGEGRHDWGREGRNSAREGDGSRHRTIPIFFCGTHLNDRIEVDIDDFVQIARNDFGDFVQSLEVVRAVGLIHEGGEVEGRQIAHSDLLRKVRERESNC